MPGREARAEFGNLRHARHVQPGIPIRLNIFIVVLLALVFTSVAQAQFPLHLHAVSYRDGVPALFKAALVNDGDTTIHLSPPRPFCASPSNGGIVLVATFHSPDPRLGYFGPGCAEATGDVPAKWIKLLPLQSLTINLDARSRGWVTPRGAGYWEVHAVYQPPSFSAPEKLWLKEHWYRYPDVPVASDELVFRTKGIVPFNLHIQSPKSHNGLPTELTAKLTNRGKYAVYLPRPVLHCTDDYNGFLELSIAFQPSSVLLSGSGQGCGEGVYDAPHGAARLQQWLMLAPRQSLRFSIPTRNWIRDQGAGRYNISLNYRPPVITAEEQQQLRRQHMHYPESDIASNHLVIQR